MAVNIEGALPRGVSAKDVILAVIGRMGVSGGAGRMVEYRGSTIRAMSMEARMTVCNMSIEWGARVGMVAPDERTYAYLEGRPQAPQGKAWESALGYWRTLPTDEGATFETEFDLDARSVEPQVTWGTNPGQVVSIKGQVPQAQDEGMARALVYMGLKAGMAMEDIAINRVFIGSCTNARIEDLRVAASVVAGKRVKTGVRAMVVPGSTPVKLQAEKEGLDQIFLAAGFEWRDAGCSMCLGMNEDILGPLERCAATSNRNFEGRQGAKGRTHLMSPAMAAAAAIEGKLVDVREWDASF
jgi:3-isopropylmalate/(R)-2-methylmalate dehydratase large subunit